MKVLNLCCGNDHRFEGWFGSDDDFKSQLERSMIECPLCADHTITRLPSAPRLNVSGAREEPTSRSSPAPSRSSGAGASAAARTEGRQADLVPAERAHEQAQAQARTQAHMQAQWMEAVKHAMANTEDVGQHFAEEARRMHYGEAEERAIRGRTSLEEAQSLRDEGIEVVALPIPAALKGTMQ